MLRSIGMLRREVVYLIASEAGVLGIVSALLGLALGSLLSYVWVAVHVRHILGWVIDYHFSVWGSLVAVSAALVLAPLAGWRPARHAARMLPVVALAQD
jgi:putative ABC transport system permease protein